MSCIRRCFSKPFRLDNSASRHLSKRFLKTSSDQCGIPTEPTWSVDKLLSSYSKPTLSSSTLTRLHQLSALIPPLEGTPEHEILKQEMEEIIRLVEAVRLVDTQGVHPSSHCKQPDVDEVLPTHTKTPNTSEEEVRGRCLLEHAARTQDGFYVVDANRRP
jgi:Asp-tRNA(Asn)/Glu-tRNA(Gln) amidotransferase C subunit